MPNKHNDTRRHHIPKMTFRVANWAAYEAGLRRRGSLTLWVSDAAITAWRPPRATAVPSAAAETAPTQRARHIQSLAEHGRLGWQRQTGYGQRAKAETAMARDKRILGDQLHARTLSRQQAEAAVRGTILNRMIGQARPNSVRIA